MTNEPKTTAEQRDYPPLPEPERESYRIWRGGCLFTADQMRAYYDLGRDKARAWMHLADQRAIEVAGLKVELQRLRALAASPTAQAAPGAVAVPSGLTEETFCDLQFAERVLIAIAERQQQTGGVIEPVADIRHASRLARAARTRITRALAALSADFDAALCAAPQPPAEAQEPVVTRATVIEWLDALGIEVTDKQMAGLFQAYPAPQQAAPTSEQAGDEEALRERDEAEEFIDALLDEVLGSDRPEWSNVYGRTEALQDVQERITALHAPAVDQAWERFQATVRAPASGGAAPACPGVPDPRCNYLASCGRACNKCGKVHRPELFKAPVAEGDARQVGLIAAADYIDGLASGYAAEHSYTEPDTGAVVFDRRDAGLEYHSTLVELADDLRGMAARAQAKEGGGNG